MNLTQRLSLYVGMTIYLLLLCMTTMSIHEHRDHCRPCELCRSLELASTHAVIGFAPFLVLLVASFRLELV
ncbi:hypothetical protein M433DRAFT_330369 [Acidomyces richmondensis BFW]|nr:MAG: hypothetical protein FE78DRAFT_471403 [Acidomyces sp. 'richmondensis']KYG43845.1 hypothetical protein M433DRAFT_330369 [Acidomyces richmondensis BFW]